MLPDEHVPEHSSYFTYWRRVRYSFTAFKGKDQMVKLLPSLRTDDGGY